MRVLVTGVSGLLGGRVARRLDAAGHSVRGLIRDPGRWTDPPAGVEAVPGDLCESHQVIEAADGCEAILHVAALTEAGSSDGRKIDRVNVQGYGHVVEAARQSGARLIHVSSVVALGPTEGETHDEESPRATMEFQGGYERTLWVADQMARHLAGSGLPLVRLYPGFLFGPGATPACNPVARLFRDHLRGGRAASIDPGAPRRCFAYLDDVVEGILQALERAPAGAAYVLGGENRSMSDLLEALAAATGTAPPGRRALRLPTGLAVRLQRWKARLPGLHSPVSGEEVAQQRHEWAYDSGRAVRELGFRITAFDKAVAETVSWLGDEDDR